MKQSRIAIKTGEVILLRESAVPAMQVHLI